MRRLRAAMSIFKRVVADERSDTVRNELRALAGELGEARDIDVLLEKTIAPARQRHPDEADLAALAVSYEERREAAYDEVIEELESGRFARTVLDAAGWIETGPWLAQGTSAAARDEPAEAFAAKELARRAKRIRKRGKHIEELEPEARHELRIAVKKLRYACEFFAPLFPGTARCKRKKALRSALGDLQDRLGDLNDVAVAAAMHGMGEHEAAARLLAQDLAGRSDEHLAGAIKAYREFAAAEPFWD
jgi:triphosphatase